MHSSRDKERMQAFYDGLLAEYGAYTPGAVSWISQKTRDVRLEVLSEVADMSNHLVLDVGCGFGDLYGLLRKKYANVDYRGIDVNEQFIAAAKEKFPDAQLEVQDFNDYRGTVACVLASGALTFKIENAKDVYFEMIKKMFKTARVAVAFNMLNKDEHSDDDTFTAYSISEVEEFCRNLTPNIRIRTDYLPHDFTVYLYH